MTGSDVREKEGCEAFTPGAAEYVAQVVHPDSIHVTPKRLVRFVLTALVYTNAVNFVREKREWESQLYTYIVNDVRFSVLFFGSFWIWRANQVDLVVFKLSIAHVDIDDIVCRVNPESVSMKREEAAQARRRSSRTRGWARGGWAGPGRREEEERPFIYSVIYHRQCAKFPISVVNTCTVRRKKRKEREKMSKNSAEYKESSRERGEGIWFLVGPWSESNALQFRFSRMKKDQKRLLSF